MALRQVKDTPTNNFATINPLNAGSSVTTSNGNLSISSNEFALATMAVSSGRWYYETHVQSTNGGQISVAEIDKPHQHHHVDGGDQYNCFGLYANGQSVRNGVYTNYASAYGAGTILGCCFDLKLGKIWFSLNGAWVNGDANSYSYIAAVTEAHSGLSGRMCPRLGHYNNDSPCTQNFGQNPDFSGNKPGGGGNYQDANGLGSFYYQPPDGALALCSRNIQSVEQDGSYVQNYTSAKGNFRAVTWVGGESPDGVKIQTGFKPDLIWAKNRDTTHYHQIHDSVRGSEGGVLYSNELNAQDPTYSMKSFDADGFTLSDQLSAIHGTGNDIVAWCWKAGGAPADNKMMKDGEEFDVPTTGSITPSKMSVNTKAGFSIVKWSGNSTDNATLPTGLTDNVEFLIVKISDSSASWFVSMPNFNTELYLDKSTDNFYPYYNISNANNLITFGNSSNITVNNSGNYIAYCWHSVAGYSKFGSYVGNGSADGPFVECGFRPAWVMIKQSQPNGQTGSNSWWITDSARYEFNGDTPDALRADTSASENTGNSALMPEYLSNGFKITGLDSAVNATGSEYIYMAFAEQPGAFSNAR